MFSSNSVLLLACVWSIVQGLDVVEGSGEDVLDQSEDSSRSIVEKQLDKKMTELDSVRTLLNATLQLELIHAANHMSRGSVGLTMWLRLEWNDPKFKFEPFEENGLVVDMITLPIDNADNPRRGMQNPDAVIKNAIYYKEIASPTANAYLAIFSNGSIVQNQKVVVDLPCQLEFKSSNRRRTTNHQWMDVCLLEYGSYIRSRQLLRLYWHQYAFVKNSVPCSPASSSKFHSPVCELQSTVTSTKTAMQLRQPFDELYSELRFLRIT